MQTVIYIVTLQKSDQPVFVPTLTSIARNYSYQVLNNSECAYSFSHSLFHFLGLRDKHVTDDTVSHYIFYFICKGSISLISNCQLLLGACDTIIWISLKLKAPGYLSQARAMISDLQGERQRLLDFSFCPYSHKIYAFLIQKHSAPLHYTVKANSLFVHRSSPLDE